MSRGHRITLFLKWLGSAWQATILGLLYRRILLILCVVVHTKSELHLMARYDIS